jgi:competence protein ComEA
VPAGPAIVLPGRGRRVALGRPRFGRQVGLLDPGRRGLAVLAVLAVVGALIGGWFFLEAKPSVAEAAGYSSNSSAAVVSAGAAAGMAPLPGGWAGSSATPSPVALVVDVVGKVRRPGVVEVDAGARVDDAIEAAGGALPGTDLTGLDLAARVADGEQIFVGLAIPTASAAGGGAVGGVVGGPAGGAAAEPTSAIIDLNTAGLAALETLPGVGAVLGQRIIDWRSAHGRFDSVEQLQQVSGIGPAKYAAFAALVTV